jgi:hypothetical protein
LVAKLAALARFVQNWTETVLLPGLIRLVLLDIHRHCPPEDQDYFRRSREERFGATLEQVMHDRQARLPTFRTSLDPLRRTVERQDFISCKTPAYADYIVFGAFQWGARSAISRCLRPMIRSGSGAAACSTCSTASLVAPPPTATERALEYMRAAAGLARPWHD